MRQHQRPAVEGEAPAKGLRDLPLENLLHHSISLTGWGLSNDGCLGRDRVRACDQVQATYKPLLTAAFRRPGVALRVRVEPLPGTHALQPRGALAGIQPHSLTHDAVGNVQSGISKTVDAHPVGHALQVVGRRRLVEGPEGQPTGSRDAGTDGGAASAQAVCPERAGFGLLVNGGTYGLGGGSRGPEQVPDDGGHATAGIVGTVAESLDTGVIFTAEVRVSLSDGGNPRVL